jgi:AcrR family transcriptional regulator
MSRTNARAATAAPLRISDRAPHQLPRGRHGMPRDQVVRNQRERMMRALAEAMVEKGYVATSVADVLRRSGTSRETFYQQFESKQDCFIAAYEEAARAILAGTRRAAGKGESTLERFESAITAYLDALAAEPAFARLFLLEVYAAGSAALEKRARLQRRFADLMADRLRANTPTERFACDMLVAGTAAMVTARLAAGDINGLRGLRAPLTNLVAHALANRAGGDG